MITYVPLSESWGHEVGDYDLYLNPVLIQQFLVICSWINY